MKHLAIFILLLLGTLAFLFSGVFDPNMVMFSNDSPYGAQASRVSRVPDLYWHGTWNDMNSIGTKDPDVNPFAVSSGVRTLCWYGVMPWLLGLLVCLCVFVLCDRWLPKHQDKIRRFLWCAWFSLSAPVCLSLLAGMVAGFDAEALEALGSLGGVSFVSGVFLVLLDAPLPDPEEIARHKAWWRRYNETGQT